MSQVNNNFESSSEIKDRIPKGEWQILQDATDKARSTIQNLMEKVYPTQRDEGCPPDLAELDPLTEDMVAPDTGKQLSEARDLVSKCVAAHDELEKYRINFKDEVEHVIPLYEATRTTLEDMSAEAKRFITEGMTEVADAVKTAWNMDSACQDEFDSAIDPPKYIELVGHYAQCVKDAQRIFEEAKEELRRREAEKAERRELQDILDHLPDTIKESQNKVKLATGLGFTVEEGRERTEKLE